MPNGAELDLGWEEKIPGGLQWGMGASRVWGRLFLGSNPLLLRLGPFCLRLKVHACNSLPNGLEENVWGERGVNVCKGSQLGIWEGGYYPHNVSSCRFNEL